MPTDTMMREAMSYNTHEGDNWDTPTIAMINQREADNELIKAEQAIMRTARAYNG